MAKADSQHRSQLIDDAEVEAIRNLMHQLAFGMRRRGLLTGGQASGLQWLDQHVLEMVVAGEEAVAIKDVRERFEMPQSSLTSVINRLEKQGLLVRRIHPDDRRSYLLEATAAGRKAQADHEARDRSVARALLSPLDRDERKTIVKLLNKVVD
jgi:DNA-binding MarR family transcriptional regulator